MLQPNFGITGGYTKSQISNHVAGLPSSRSPQTNIEAQLLPSGNQLSTSGGVLEESVDASASFQTQGNSGVELETDFKQLLTLDIEPVEPSIDDAVVTQQNLELANLAPLVETELAKKLDASNPSILAEVDNLQAATEDSRLQNLRAAAAVDEASSASLAKLVSLGAPTFKPHPHQVVADAATPEVGDPTFKPHPEQVAADAAAPEVGDPTFKPHPEQVAADVAAPQVGDPTFKPHPQQVAADVASPQVGDPTFKPHPQQVAADIASAEVGAPALKPQPQPQQVVADAASPEVVDPAFRPQPQQVAADAAPPAINAASPEVDAPTFEPLTQQFTVGATSPNAGAVSPEVVVASPEVVVASPEVVVASPEAGAGLPEVVIASPKVDAILPEVAVPTFEPFAQQLTMGATSPEVGAAPTEIDAPTLKIFAQQFAASLASPKVDAPAFKRFGQQFAADAASSAVGESLFELVDTAPIEFGAVPPAAVAPSPVLGAALSQVVSPTFEADLVSLDAGSLSFEVIPSAFEAGTPLFEAGTSLFEAGTSLFEMPPPASDEFDFTAANHAKTSLDAEVPNQLVPTLADVAKPAAPSVRPATVTSPSEITKAVIDNLVQEVQLTVNGEHKRLTLQLHPAELGQVSLQLDWENESLKLKIISNEMVTSEILSQNKTELVSMLAEQGIDFESLDLSYESPTSEDESQQKKSNSQSLDPTMFASDSTVEDEIESLPSKSDASGLDITI